MPRHKKGTLVRISEEALEPDYCDRSAVESAIERGGGSPLFVIERWLRYRHPENPYSSSVYIARSVVTGEKAEFFPNEITTRKPKEQKNNDS